MAAAVAMGPAAAGGKKMVMITVKPVFLGQSCLRWREKGSGLPAANFINKYVDYIFYFYFFVFVLLFFFFFLFFLLSSARDFVDFGQESGRKCLADVSEDGVEEVAVCCCERMRSCGFREQCSQERRRRQHTSPSKIQTRQVDQEAARPSSGAMRRLSFYTIPSVMA